MADYIPIYRFMRFEHLLDLLKHRRLPLINPSQWEDKNDVFAIKLSCDKDESIGVCCFTISGANGMYRWSKMASNNLCVRVEFDRKKIENRLPENMELFDVKYVSAKRLNDDYLKSLEECAYIKSTPYKQEKEARLVMRCDKKQGSKKVVGYLNHIPRDAIKGICLSPFLRNKEYSLVKEFLKSYLDKEKIKINFTHAIIFNVPKWKDALEKATEKLKDK